MGIVNPYIAFSVRGFGTGSIFPAACPGPGHQWAAPCDARFHRCIALCRSAGSGGERSGSGRLRRRGFPPRRTADTQAGAASREPVHGARLPGDARRIGAALARRLDKYPVALVSAPDDAMGIAAHEDPRWPAHLRVSSNAGSQTDCQRTLVQRAIGGGGAKSRPGMLFPHSSTAVCR